METTFYSPVATATQSKSVEDNCDLDSCIALAWLELVALKADALTGDDWLALCDDIDTGEIYRNWFLWQDTEVSGDWEAYDHVTNRRFAFKQKAALKVLINRIEDARNSAIAQLEFC